ncbi:MAG: four helix bundle protein [Anaerolineae bacterium]|nr:four helix bundle protein [Gemmatimonadaceae bacterium]
MNEAAERTSRTNEDPLWKMTVYRLAVLATEKGWEDARSIQRQRLTEPLASQLYRALGSIGANIAEGYSRGSGARPSAIL